MARLSALLFFLSVVASCLSPAAPAAVIPRQDRPKMSDFFTVHSDCNTDRLDALLTATLDMLDKTIQALTTLLETSNPFDAGSEKYNYMRNLHHTFGTAFYRRKDTGLSAADVQIAKDRRDWYQKLRNSLSMDHDDRIRPADGWIVCGGEKPDGPFVRTSNPWDMHISKENIPNGDQAKFAAEFSGRPWAYVIPDLRNADDYAEPVSWAQGREGQWNEKHACAPGSASTTLAFVARKASVDPKSNKKLMVLCGTFWDTTRALVDLTEVRENVNTAGITGSITKDPDDYTSRPGTFVHELCHWLGADSWPDTPFDYRPSNGGRWKRGLKPYGAVNINALANRLSQITTTKADRYNYPDMYRIFAETSYASKKKWFDYSNREPSRKIRRRTISPPPPGWNISGDLSGGFWNTTEAD